VPVVVVVDPRGECRYKWYKKDMEGAAVVLVSSLFD
jgi:hypothetical protein